MTGMTHAQVERAKLLALATEEELKLLTRTQELAEEVTQSFPASMQLIKAVSKERKRTTMRCRCRGY